MALQELLDALASSGGGAQRQDLSDIGQGTVVPDAEGYKNLAKGSVSATLGLPGDLEELVGLLMQAKQGYIAPDSDMDTTFPTSSAIGESLGADTESTGFGVGEVFSADPTGPFGKILGAALPLIMKVGKKGPMDAITKALTDTQTQKGFASGGFDPRFDPRKREQEKLRNLTIQTEGERAGLPEIPLEDLQGRGVLTTMSDRSAEGPPITHIRGVPLVRPVGRYGGQDFMGNPENILQGNAWQSAEVPVKDIMAKSAILEKRTGKPTILAPWQMAPTGGDFSLSTGDAMLTFAASNMDNATKSDLDKAIKEYKTIGKWMPAKKDDAGKVIREGRQVGDGLSIKGFKGVDDPNMFEVWSKQPDSVRKELKNMMDKQFRDRGGLGIGEARIAIADAKQLETPDTTLMNLAEIYSDLPITNNPNPGSYPKNARGQVVGKLKEDVQAYQLLPNAEKQRNLIDSRVESGEVMDVLNPSANDKRAIQMKAYGGIIDDEILKAILG